MWDARLRATAFWTLLIVTLFNALSAVISGIALLLTGGLGMPTAFLTGSVFASFTWPGVILVVIVGGTQTLAAVWLIRRRESALLWSAVAGFGMLIWIFVEVLVIPDSSWLQVTYFATGSAQLALTFALLGIVGWLPRRSLRSTTSANTDLVRHA